MFPGQFISTYFTMALLNVRRAFARRIAGLSPVKVKHFCDPRMLFLGLYWHGKNVSLIGYVLSYVVFFQIAILEKSLELERLSFDTFPWFSLFRPNTFWYEYQVYECG